MKRLQVTSLRKGGALLQEAVEAWQEGEALSVPSECGYFHLDPGGEIWFSHQPPPLDSPELEAVAQVFWPGPLRLRLRHPQGKRSWQVPAHPLAQALLTLIGPVRGRFVGPLEPDHGVVLAWKEPCLNLPVSEVDCACTPWRWLRSGSVERRHLEWVSGRPTLLSGRALPDHSPQLTSPAKAERPSWRVDP